MSKRRRGYRRGYPIAVLIGFDQEFATLWRIFKHVVKQDKSIESLRSNKRELYNFHEKIVNALRPILREGVGNIIVAAPTRTNHTKAFFDHISKHHAWMKKGVGSASFTEIVASASTFDEVSSLINNGKIKGIIDDSTAGEADRIRNLLEKRLVQDDANSILYSLNEIEKKIIIQNQKGSSEPEHLIITDRFLAVHKRRIHRLMETSRSRGIKINVVNSNTEAGQRIEQLGGMILLTKQKGRK